MKYYPTLIALLFLSQLSWGQVPQFTFADFEEQFMDYKPEQKPSVSEKDFEFAKMVIRETKSAVTGDHDGFNIADYWNISTAFIRLNTPIADVELVWQKILSTNGHCEYVSGLQQHTQLDQLFPEAYRQAVLECQRKTSQSPKEEFNLEVYAREKDLDVELLRLVHELEVNDQRYRSTTKSISSEQQVLDQQNQQQIESLYQQYDTYLGKSLVGDQYAAIMWQVIQHSNLKMMERYLPIIQTAVQEEELGVVPLKMLVDRIYAIKHNYQIFGSQQGVPLAPDHVQEEARKTFLGE